MTTAKKPEPDEIAKEYETHLISYRRQLHMHPELSFREYETAAWVRKRLHELNIPILEGVSGNSTVGVLEGDEEGPVLLFRADIDALPIREETGLDYSSQNDGVMHACGHDAHTSVLMCFAEFLSEHRELIKGKVKLVFQQGEEQVPGVGSLIVNEGVLDDVDSVFAWHCAPEHETGKVIVSGGSRTASFDNFEIIIRGRGGHGGFPHKSSHVISAGALIVSAVEGLPMKTVDPMTPVTMIISRFTSGAHGVYNIIPDEVHIEGNIRCHDTASADKLIARIQQVSEEICAASGCSREFIRHAGYPALVNDGSPAERIRTALRGFGIDARDAVTYGQEGVLMKIFMYEVREDEKKDIAGISAQLGMEAEISKAVPSLENAEFVKGFDGVSFLGQGKIGAALLDRYKELGVSCISTRTIGYNHIDIGHAKEIGIKVCNARYAPNGVADFTVMLMLMCIRQYKQAFWRGYVNDFGLNGLMGKEMKDLTVGVCGTGRIGAQVVHNLKGFGCRIIAYDVYQNPALKDEVTYVGKEELFRSADVITLHMPLLPDTQHMIDHEAVAMMKDGVVIVNCARGELCDVEALVDGIESEKIGALGMDTVEGEEGIIHEDHRTDILKNRDWFYLHQFRNVVITHHMAFYTDAAVRSMVRCGVEGLYMLYTKGEYDTRIA